ncbi:MAG: CAP domain-containing protein [Myxococcota bacterium]
MPQGTIAFAFALLVLPACDGDDGSGGDTDASVATGTGGGPGGGDAADQGPGDGAEDGSQSGECADGPLAAPIAGCAPAVLASTGDPHQDCVDRINQLRWECQCLPPLMRWNDAEGCTDDQSSADQAGGGAHANFGSCNEFGQNTCPNWGSEAQVIDGCLQSMWDEGPGEPFSAHGHYINMTNPDYTKVACGFAGGGSGVWSNQNFSN